MLAAVMHDHESNESRTQQMRSRTVVRWRDRQYVLKLDGSLHVELGPWDIVLVPSGRICVEYFGWACAWGPVRGRGCGRLCSILACRGCCFGRVPASRQTVYAQ